MFLKPKLSANFLEDASLIYQSSAIGLVIVSKLRLHRKPGQES
jgi:hypothetical protein